MTDSEHRSGGGDHSNPAYGSRPQEILGLSTDELAGLSVDELTNNKTAITMLIHYYRILVDQNGALKNDLNTAKGYVDSYSAKKQSAFISAMLFLVANISIGFGVNLLTADHTWPGLAALIPGIAMSAAGTFLAFKER